jgi:hypothetical protein
MRRALLVRLAAPLAAALPFLALAACDGGIALPPGPPALTAEARAGFPIGGVVDTIVVSAVDRLPLRAAALVAPDGVAIPASYIDVVASPGFATGQRVAGNPWQNSISGGNAIPALAIQNAQASAALESREQLLATVSTADIALPDPVVYRRDWRHYRIRLTFGAPPGEVETRELPAPAPSPGS